MIFTRPWWLAGLAVLLPLILLHLRRPTFSVREVASILVWDRFTRPADAPQHRLRAPRHPVLLALQVLVVVALVGALAGPRLASGSTAPRTVFVVDTSVWMRIGGRLGAAREAVLRLAAAERRGDVVVIASGEPATVLYQGARSGLATATTRLVAARRPASLDSALAVAAGLANGPQGRLVVVRAPEDVLPQLSAPARTVSDVVVGTEADDQGIFDASARCGIGPSSVCEVLATIRNGSSRSRVDRYTARAGTGPPLELRLAVAAHASRQFVLTAPPATTVVLALAGRDALAADNAVSVAVPGSADVPADTSVLLVGDPTVARPIARALASVPGVTLTLRTQASYRASEARRSDLVVLDDWVPPGGLPPAPAVLLVHPASLPGGAVTGSIPLPLVTGEDSGSELMDDVDLGSLSIDRDAAETVTLPQALAPVAWADGGTLLAAGDDGLQRVAVLTFDVARSNLAQLPALPILLRNVVRWASGWATVGDAGTLRVDAVPDATQLSVGSERITLHGRTVGLADVQPGRIEIAATGAGAAHKRTLVSGLDLPSQTGAAALDLNPALSESLLRRGRSLDGWLLALALVAMLGEWALWRRLRR